MALRAASSAATCAAYGVDLREPLKPMVPADDQAIELPCTSVIVIMVLLKLAFTCATPEAMFLRSRRRTRAASFAMIDPLAAQAADGLSVSTHSRILLAAYFFLPAMGFAGPLRVRALVCVRCPRTGRPRRCRRPR